ncbi:hypothetical protein IM816_03035 [Luteibacter flocculans]|uniref:Uncharacterized protein n=1 Tax=Luteibacter flocculans TaxID=2780091 RepID=A0ABY4T5D2_9GAMM|nr:hypothetical protein [Luteibacter flocculans]URL59107.1 hypothetical protein IM816_03035 [Luteibacter flocculans]
MDGWLRVLSRETMRTFRMLSLATLLLCIATETALSSDVIIPALGGETVQRLIARYNDTRRDCGDAKSPAFLCSGILLRGTVASPKYHVWDPSPSSIATGGVSFSFLRKDAEFNQLALGYTNGFIVAPYQSVEGKLTPKILCSFPVDAATDQRNENGCGVYRGNAASATCQRQGLSDAEGWRKTYMKGTGYAMKYAQCGFDVTGDDAAPAFYESLKAMKYAPSFAGNNPENEVRMEPWPQGVPKELPIEAFFYVPGGLDGAKYNQRDYYAQTNILLPIIRMTLPSAPSADTTFAFVPQEQTMGMGPDVPKLAPKLREASAENGTRLLLSDFYRADRVTVVVPIYAGMAPGHTVGAQWKGPFATYDTAIATVAAVAPIELTVPRREVVDAIGKDVEITFTVKRGDEPVEASAPLTVSVEAQALELPAPELDADHKQVIVRFPTLGAGHQVNVRLQGATTLDLPIKTVTNQTELSFAIPATWLQQNRDRVVYVTYAVATIKAGDLWQFSRVLRVKL